MERDTQPFELDELIAIVTDADRVPRRVDCNMGVRNKLL